MKLYAGESEPIADNPILRGVDLALERLVKRDCFTERTLAVLDELRAEVLAVHVCAYCPTCGVHDGEHHKCCGCYDGVCCQEPNLEIGGK